MPDNVTTQSATPATLPDTTAIAAAEGTFSGDTVLAGVGLLAKSTGAEGSRSFSLVDPATEAGQTTGNASLASIDGKLPSLGQALAAASVPVVLTAAQLSTLTPPAAITGFLTEADFDTKVGALTEAAPTTDTASSGLNGRLQRIAQRLSSLIALLPTALGAGGGLKVDGSGTALPVSGTVTANAGTGPFPVSDNGGSLTVDAPVGTPVFVRLSDGAAAIATLPISAASLPLPSGAATDAALKPALTVGAVQATASGDTTLLASGTRKLRRIEASNSSTSAAVTVGLKVPSLNSGATFGKKYLPASGGLAVWVFPSGYLQVTSEAVSVNLSGAGQVEVTAYYE